MGGMLDDIDMRTQMAGQNRLEMLLFRMHGQQLFGINVFKVKEVVHCPPLTELPGANPVIRGIASLRGTNIPVMDLSHAVGGPRMGNSADQFVIITEYNRKMLGFLVGSVERIINMNWEDVLPPPVGLGRAAYMTAVTRVDDHLVEILDVEKVLSEILGVDETITQSVDTLGQNALSKKVLIVDDSIVARKQISRVMDELGIECVTKKDGSEALEQLEAWSEEGRVSDWLSMIISDIEMPKMDGYALVMAIRKNPKLADLYVILHSSLSGVFNEAMVKKVGADHFLAKFNPDELVQMVSSHLKGLD
ncbi:MAG: chemotaxis protein CheV [Gammaproteobacteria bacterium]|nr:chemotaxis protein CheV [Gammaproteobacteria bacterium]